MDSKKENIMEAAGRIIVRSGAQNLTMDSLARELNWETTELTSHIQKEEDVFNMLLQGLENELTERIEGISVNNKSPETELEILFNGLYSLFKRKPWYLSFIFDKSILKHKRSRHKISQIKRLARKYLVDLIDRGKREMVFVTTEDTKILVNDILESFQILMNDVQLANKMIWSLKKSQSTKDL
jgi:AcrR family transcriptional regulator